MIDTKLCGMEFLSTCVLMYTLPLATDVENSFHSSHLFNISPWLCWDVFYAMKSCAEFRKERLSSNPPNKHGLC